MNPAKKREADSGLPGPFSLHHVNLAYWMGRSLGDKSRTLKDWKGYVFEACGTHVPLGAMTEQQAKATLIASRACPNLPASTEHMTQRMN